MTIYDKCSKCRFKGKCDEHRKTLCIKVYNLEAELKKAKKELMLYKYQNSLDKVEGLVIYQSTSTIDTGTIDTGNTNKKHKKHKK